jgi:WD40 repeat protein/serine/threonine protein kinase
MAECPPRKILEDLLAESLSKEERMRVEAHVEGCRDCQATLNDLTIGATPAAKSGLISVSSDLTDKSAEPATEAFFDRLKQIKPRTKIGTGPSKPNTLSAPVQIEGYKILGELGRGAAGVVYRALHLKLNRLVALKVIVAGQHLSQELRQRFRIEAQAIARLQHPNIVQIFDVGEHSQFPFLSLELVEGGNLADWTGGKPRPPVEAARIVCTLARAVEYAHGQGVVHRDLKPSNVMLGIVSGQRSKRELKITDFGIARMPVAGAAESRMTQTGELLGTPAYMAPEQARANPNEIGPATDTYSLGAILYELLTGRPPFQGATPLDTLMQATRQDPVSISLLVPRVPRDLNTICLKCLEKDPAKRYRTTGELADDLGRFLKNEPIHARPLSPVGRLARWTRRHEGLAAALSGVFLLLVALSAGSLIATAHFRKLEQEEKTLADEKEIERGKAVTAQQNESELRRQAENAALELRKNSYFDQMNLAAQAAISPSGIGRVSDWLAPWAQGEPDLRNWEWFYFDGICHRDLLTISQHEHEVQDVAWDIKGERIASAGADGKVWIWGAFDGQEIRSLSGNQIDLRRVAWSRDGQRLATVSWDGTATIWSPDTGEKILKFAGNGTTLLSITWSADGKRVATAGMDHTIKIWNAATGSIEFILRGHTSDVRDVAWSPDGKQIASASADHDIRIWDSTTGNVVRTLRGHLNFVNRIAWSPDGSEIASASNDLTAKIWNAESGAELRTLRGHVLGVSSLAWSPDGTKLVTGSDDQTLKMWSVKDGVELFTLRGHTARITSVGWRPDGTRIATGSSDSTIKIWDAAEGAEVTSLVGHKDSVNSLAWSPDGKRLASGGADQIVRIWMAAAATEQFGLPGHSGQLHAVAWSPDGTRLASAGEDHTIRLWDAIGGSELKSIHVDTDLVCSLAWSPDSRQLASGGFDHLVRIWDASSGREVQQCQGHEGNVNCLAWSPDSKSLASASGDATVRIWDPLTGQQSHLLSGHTSEVCCVTWSPDGNMLASGGFDQTVKIWNATTGVSTLTLRGHTARVTAVAWNPDGSRLASSSEDHTVKLWDAAAGKETVSLDCHARMVFTMAWSPDGVVLASGGDDGTILLHDATAGYVHSLAPQYVPILDRRLALDEKNASDFEIRGEIQAGQGNWDEAAADFKKCAAIDDRKRWFAIGYWVAGPYSDDVRASFSPEHIVDPGQHLNGTSVVGPKALLNWKIVPVSGSGFLDLGKLFDHAEHISAYALLRIYSPHPRKVACLMGQDDTARVWINGWQVYENLVEGSASPDFEAYPVHLSEGWNTAVVRVFNDRGDHALYFRLSDAEVDLKRADDETREK